MQLGEHGMDWKANHRYMCFRMILMPTTRHDRMDIQLGLFSVISYLYPEFAAAATLLSFCSFCLYFMYSTGYALYPKVFQVKLGEMPFLMLSQQSQQQMMKLKIIVQNQYSTSPTTAAVILLRLMCINCHC